MTDARLRSEWHGSLRFDDLSDVAWRVFTGALMWSNEHGTDGFIPTRYVSRLHPDGHQPNAVQELVSREFWEPTETGYQLLGWVGVLGQSTAETVEGYRAMARNRMRNHRRKQAEAREFAERRQSEVGSDS